MIKIGEKQARSRREAGEKQARSRREALKAEAGEKVQVDTDVKSANENGKFDDR
ncbi:hypothetical protein E4U31_004207 [Claviceps sp. LM219 group G6]|nr:hypothetical protein E4U31_004207 [Claviceps sp. LM219 group G6]